ncbi:MAG: hypothetical protein CMJ78_02475 [Planctomycetaceae bacterium]|nr:hypothetical protein [Planctomycetaceae bacterium]
MKALEKSSSNRFQSADEFVTEIRRTLAAGLTHSPGRLTIDSFSSHPRSDHSCLLVLDVTNIGGSDIEIDSVMLHVGKTQMLLTEPTPKSTVYPNVNSAPADQCAEVFEVEISGLVRPGDMEMCPMSMVVEAGTCKRLGIRVSAHDLSGKVGDLDILRWWQLEAVCILSDQSEISTESVSVCLPYEFETNAATKADEVSVALYEGEDLRYCRRLNRQLIFGRQKKDETRPYIAEKIGDARRIVICNNKTRWISRRHLQLTYDELTERVTVESLSQSNPLYVWNDGSLQELTPGEITKVELPAIVILTEKKNELARRLPFRHIVIE